MPNTLQPAPFEAYTGKEPYVFASYAHRDSALVFPLLLDLHQQGYRVWYDEGIDPGNEWPDEIANAILGCSQFLLFVTPNSIVSKNVNNEIHFAIDSQKPFLTVYLEETNLTPGLKLRIGGIQAIFKCRVAEESYRRKMEKALLINMKIVLATGTAIQEPILKPEQENKVYEGAKAVPLVATLKTKETSLEGIPHNVTREVELASPKTGDVQAVDLAGGVQLVLCGIPAGTFIMGSPASEQGRDTDESQHQVTMTKALWLGRTVVTRVQWQSVMGGNLWRAVMGGNLWRAVMGDNPSGFRNDHLPKVVSWVGATEFCEMLNLKGLLPTGWKFALPTEAQWEYACRAGTTGIYAGDLDEMAWYSGNSDRKTHPVATKKPNAWGLHDMPGSVWEWCADWYGDYPAGSVTDPSGPSSGTRRVYRGGSWLYSSTYCRSAYRGRHAPDYPDYRYNLVGFRVAAVPTGSHSKR